MSFLKLSDRQKITLPKKADNAAILDTMRNYACGIRWDVSFSDDETCVVMGEAQEATLDSKEYVIKVTEKGAFVGGKDYSSTIRGFLTLLEMTFCYGKGDYRIETCELRDSAKLKFRAVHICLFPEYSVNTIRKVIRTCGMAKYSHIILETWGCIKLDALKELSWPHGHSKETVRELVAEANAMGMEVIPFFQHLGHAALARMGYAGKHTVLDQDLSLEYLYYPKSYGWVWNFKDKDVKKLLSDVRAELIDLFGEGEYFHLGCDEAGMEFDSDCLCSWLNEVQADLEKQGRRAIIWGDMLLSNAFFPDEPIDPRHPWRIVYECNSTSEYADALCEKLNKNIIIADWQYNVEYPVWKSSKILSEKGFDVICCPWELHDNVSGAVNTAAELGLQGIMETTWNKLIVSPGVQNTVYAGLCAWGDPKFAGWFDGISDRAYNIFRRVAPEGKTYETSGWSEKQI